MTPTTATLAAEQQWVEASKFWAGVGDPCRVCGGMSVGPVLVGGAVVRACTECRCLEDG